MMLRTVMTSAAVGAMALANQNPLVVHEWGTFTSVQGSDGIEAAGLTHEEESLPAFVHGRDPLHEASLKSGFSVDPGLPPVVSPSPRPTFRPRPRPCGKGFGCEEFALFGQSPSLEVTQKMETPVIYLHSPFGQKVHIEVGFPQGIISQYYPAPTSFSPAIGAVDGLQGGLVKFDVEVVKDKLLIPAVDPSNVYAPSRNVEADFMRTTQGENEKLIFYRGLGAFNGQLNVTSKGRQLILVNLREEAVPAAFLVYVAEDGRGSIRSVGSIPGEYGTAIVEASKVDELVRGVKPVDAFLSGAGFELTSALRATGLNADEALAMTETWKRSYFRTPGLRVLYVLPQEETERLLPMKLSPQPKELVRTLVGRIEVLPQADEVAYLARIKVEGDGFPFEREFGRFAEAKLNVLLGRADSMKTGFDPALIAKIRELRDRAKAQR